MILLFVKGFMAIPEILGKQVLVQIKSIEESRSVPVAGLLRLQQRVDSTGVDLFLELDQNVPSWF